MPEFLAGVWKDVLHRPVEISQVFTTPSMSLDMETPPSACRLADQIEGGVLGLAMTEPVDGVPICQNLTDLSNDTEMREEGEENVREVIILVWPIKVSMR